MIELDALERLARLRADGSLSEEEFETEKARLLASERQKDETKWRATDVGERKKSAPGLAFWLCALILLGGALSLSAWGWLSPAQLRAAASAKDLEKAVSSKEAWTFARASDPMNDEELLIAQRRIDVDAFFVDAEVSCRPATNTVQYTFTTFLADGRVAEAKQTSENSGRSYLAARIRVDADDAETFQIRDPRYTNRFEIAESREGLELGRRAGRTAEYLPAARRLTVQLDLKNGRPTFTIDQTENVLDHVLRACKAAAPAPREEEAAPAAIREPRTFTFDVTDKALAASLAGELNGRALHTAKVCVGDTIALRNRSLEYITLLGGSEESDKILDEFEMGPGAVSTYEVQMEGSFLVIEESHPEVRFDYEATQC